MTSVCHSRLNLLLLAFFPATSSHFVPDLYPFLCCKVHGCRTAVWEEPLWLWTGDTSATGNKHLLTSATPSSRLSFRTSSSKYVGQGVWPKLCCVCGEDATCEGVVACVCLWPLLRFKPALGWITFNGLCPTVICREFVVNVDEVGGGCGVLLSRRAGGG